MIDSPLKTGMRGYISDPDRPTFGSDGKGFLRQRYVLDQLVSQARVRELYTSTTVLRLGVCFLEMSVPLERY